MSFCNTNSEDGLPTLTVSQAKQYTQAQWIDVRRPDEFVGPLGHIEGARLVTLETDLEAALPHLPKDQTYIFVCRSGGRSGRATELALQSGFQSVFNMAGGMIAWNEAGYPVVSKE